MLTYTIAGICIGVLAALLFAGVRHWHWREFLARRKRMDGWAAKGGPQRHSGGRA